MHCNSVWSLVVVAAQVVSPDDEVEVALKRGVPVARLNDSRSATKAGNKPENIRIIIADVSAEYGRAIDRVCTSTALRCAANPR